MVMPANQLFLDYNKIEITLELFPEEAIPQLPSLQ